MKTKEYLRRITAKVIDGHLSHPVLVSHKSLLLRFISCGPDCISKGCTSKCCDAPSSDLGIKVFVHDKEIAGIKKAGGKVVDNFLQPRKGERVCPFKTADHLCGLWQRPERPLGCIVSPFAFNKTGTLIVRNRYKLLPCYDKVNGEPAYKVFKASLVALFGNNQYDALAATMTITTHDHILWMRDEIYQKVRDREETYHLDAITVQPKGHLPKAGRR